MTVTNVLIRADASPSRGVGHVMRCIALAQELVVRGASVRFASRTLTPFTRNWLAKEGFEVTEVEGDYGSLGELTASLGADWTVIDLGTYFDPAGLDDVESRLMVIDDLGQRFVTPPDLVLNQNLQADQTPYHGIAEKHVLRGPSYTMFRNEFIRAVKARDKPRDRAGVLLMLGGTDPLGLLPTFALSIASAIKGPLVVLTSSSHPDIAELRRIAEEVPDIRLLEDVQNVATIMCGVRLAVTSGGTAVWELAALGVPALVGAVADMEELTLAGLTAAGMFEVVGSYRDIDARDLAQLVRRRSADPVWLAATARKATSLIDGNGRSRVVDAMF